MIVRLAGPRALSAYKSFLFAFALLVSFLGTLQAQTFPAVSSGYLCASQPGWLDADVGSVGLAGSASSANGTFTVGGSGTQIYGSADSFHFAFQTLSGDGSIVARVVSAQGGSGYAAAGVMIRETLDSASTNVKSTSIGNFPP